MNAAACLALAPNMDHILTRLLPEGGMWLLVCLALSAVGLWFAQSRYGLLTRFRDEKLSPINLGIARAAIFAGLVLMVGYDELLAFGNLDDSLILPRSVGSGSRRISHAAPHFSRWCTHSL